jgi:hypothetical protein
MIRLFPVLLTLLAVGCAAPRATVVEEAPIKRPVARKSADPSPLPTEIGMREPDVASELPDASGVKAPGSAPLSRADDQPTVIARPPAGGGSETAPR